MSSLLHSCFFSLDNCTFQIDLKWHFKMVVEADKKNENQGEVRSKSALSDLKSFSWFLRNTYHSRIFSVSNTWEKFHANEWGSWSDAQHIAETFGFQQLNVQTICDLTPCYNNQPWKIKLSLFTVHSCWLLSLKFLPSGLSSFFCWNTDKNLTLWSSESEVCKL